jgi:Zn ribbon nucleic-acid-binding protein
MPQAIGDGVVTAPKMKPCPNCGNCDNLNMYAYESGWWHVECDKCFYLGPGYGSKREAIRSHNQAQVTDMPT